MGHAPFFSIVIPTYNRAHCIADAIKSVIGQTYSDWELLIMDDGSKDNTSQVIEPYLTDPRIKYEWKPNGGRSAARNRGIKMATGHYVCFLDSDDLWLPEHLQTLHASCLKHPGPAIHHTALVWQYPNGQRKKARHSKHNDTGNIIERVFHSEISPITAAVTASCIKNELFNEKISVNEDLELFVRLAVSCSIVSIKEYTAVMRITGNNTTDYQHDYLQQMMLVLRLIKNNPKTRPFVTRKFLHDRIKTIREWKIRQLDKKGNRWLLVAHLIRFLILYPTTPRNSAKLVTLLYNLPFGGLLKAYVRKRKGQTT